MVQKINLRRNNTKRNTVRSTNETHIIWTKKLSQRISKVIKY
jgi:hypothetical protein